LGFEDQYEKSKVKGFLSSGWQTKKGRENDIIERKKTSQKRKILKIKTQ
jgi:hypothetical protein